MSGMSQEEMNSDLFDEVLRLKAVLKESKDAMQEFIDRVDRGEIRSTYTYNKFKIILSKA